MPRSSRSPPRAAADRRCIQTACPNVVEALASLFHYTGRAARESGVTQSSDAAAAGAARADRELLDSLAHDPSALEVLYDRYAGLVYGLALAALRNPEDAQDLTQEIFLSLYRQANRYDPARGALAGFLTTMTRTRAIDRLRAGTRRSACSGISRATSRRPRRSHHWSGSRSRSAASACAPRSRSFPRASNACWRWPTTAGFRSRRSRPTSTPRSAP